MKKIIIAIILSALAIFATTGPVSGKGGWTKWQSWCYKHPTCQQTHQTMLWPVKTHISRLAGPVGKRIMHAPEGRHLGAFAWTHRHWNIPVKMLLAIGIIESGGGANSSWYVMGCLDGSGGKNWIKQIHCAGRVIDKCYIYCYGPNSTAYPSLVYSLMNEIRIIH